MKKFILSLLCFFSMAMYAETIVDVLTPEVMRLDGTTYYNKYTDITASSNAVYVALCANSNSSIQLRNKNSNEGIVSAQSGGTVKKVAVVWNANTANGRKVDVYGSNKSFTEPADLYKSGPTKLGTIENGVSTEIEIEGDYAYVGLCSNNNALYLEKVEITWETSDDAPVVVSRPTLSVAGGTYYEPQTLILSAPEGLSIKYTLNGGVEQDYTAPISLSEDTQLVAWCVDAQGNKSLEVTAEYVFEALERVTLASAITSIDGEVVYIGEDLTVVYQSGQYLYVKAGNTYALIYGNVGKTYNSGDVIAAGVRVKKTTYNNLVELADPANFSDGTAGAPVEPVVTDAATCSAAAWVNKYVIISGATYTAASKMLTDESGSIVLYKRFDECKLPTEDMTNVTLCGIVSIFKDTYQIYPISITGENGTVQPEDPKKPGVGLFVAEVEENGVTAYYAMTATIEKNKMTSVKVELNEDDMFVLETEDPNLMWTMDATVADKVTLKTADDKYLSYSGSSTNVALADKSYPWAYDAELDALLASTSPDRAILFRGDSKVFGAYATSNIKPGSIYTVPYFTESYVVNATAISSTQAVKAGKGIYTLSGTRVNKAVRGIYIIDGKKVVK